MVDDESKQAPEARLVGCFRAYPPALRKLGLALRAKLRARLPGLSEVVYVYARQQALVIAYSPSGRGYEAPCSLALRPDGAKLFLAGGAALSKADPAKLLAGSGKLVRYVSLEAVEDLARSEIEALITAALELAQVRLTPRAKGALLFQIDAQERRAARRRKTTRKSSKKPSKPRR